MRREAHVDFLFALLFFLSNLSVLARKVFVLLVILPRDNLVLLLDKIGLLVAHQLLLCLEIGELLVEGALQGLQNYFAVERDDFIHEKMVKPLSPLFE